jgi:hypothetical protein
LYPCRSFNSSEEQLLIAGKLLQLAAADERETETESVLLFLFNSLDFFCGWKLFRKCYRSSSGDAASAVFRRFIRSFFALWRSTL